MPKQTKLIAISKWGDLSTWTKELAIEALGLEGDLAVTKESFLGSGLATVQLYCGTKGADVGKLPKKITGVPEKKRYYWDLVVAWRLKNKSKDPVGGGVVSSPQASARRKVTTRTNISGK